MLVRFFGKRCSFLIFSLALGYFFTFSVTNSLYSYQIFEKSSTWNLWPTIFLVICITSSASLVLVMLSFTLQFLCRYLFDSLPRSPRLYLYEHGEVCSFSIFSRRKRRRVRQILFDIFLLFGSGVTYYIHLRLMSRCISPLPKEKNLSGPRMLSVGIGATFTCMLLA